MENEGIMVMMSFYRRGCMVLAVLLLCPLARTQTSASASKVAKGTLPDAEIPVYDVVSVKPNKTGSGSMSFSSGDGNFDGTNISLKFLIMNAFHLKDVQLFGLSGWENSARFDIQAKVLEPDKNVFDAMTGEQENRMLIPILTDRFQMKFHREKKPLPVYELVIAKGGTKLTESTAKSGGESAGAVGRAPGSMLVNNTEMTATAVPIERLVEMLSGRLQRVVVDKTGLTGQYDIALKWSPSDGTPAGDNAAPEIFTALQEQLGLKLVPSKAEVETFVVDQLTQPAEN